MATRTKGRGGGRRKPIDAGRASTAEERAALGADDSDSDSDSDAEDGEADNEETEAPDGDEVLEAEVVEDRDLGDEPDPDEVDAELARLAGGAAAEELD